MLDSDRTRTRTRTSGPSSLSESPNHVWVLHIAYHPKREFIGRRIVMAVGVEVAMGRLSKEFAESGGEGALQDRDISRRHLHLTAGPDHVRLRIDGKNGAIVGHGKCAKGRVVDVSDGAVIALQRSDAPVVFVLRRTMLRERRRIHPEIVGQSAEIAEIIEKIATFALGPGNVFLRGESGTGKDLVARALHNASGRPAEKYRAVNCAEFVGDSLQSELFGHVRGAFTGAIAERKGVAEAADGGTLFLDEIAEASPKVQAMLLRFLDDKGIRPLGTNDVRKLDVRIVCASNANFDELVRGDRFRHDLYYRISGATIRIPPLRERIEDIPLLAEHFLRRLDRRAHRSIGPRLMMALLCHSWPGNIRELRHVIETAVALSNGADIVELLPDIEEFLDESRLVAGQNLDDDEERTEAPLKAAGTADALRTKPRRTAPSRPSDEVLHAVLREHKGNMAVSAQKLGVRRQQLYIWLKERGIDYKRYRSK